MTIPRGALLVIALSGACAPTAWSDVFICYQNGQASTRSSPARGCTRILYTTDEQLTRDPQPRAGPNRVIVDTALAIRVQRRLAALGYDPGPIDGIVGTRTKAAIRRFQRDYALPVTGNIDALLLSAFDNVPN